MLNCQGYRLQVPHYVEMDTNGVGLGALVRSGQQREEYKGTRGISQTTKTGQIFTLGCGLQQLKAS